MDGPRLTVELPARVDELHMLEDIGVITSERLPDGQLTYEWALVPGALARVARRLEDGERWGTKRVAEHLRVSRKTVSSYRARGQMPPEDGRDGPHAPWSLSTTITSWERPGQGAGGGKR